MRVSAQCVGRDKNGATPGKSRSVCVKGVFICMFSLSYLLVDTFQAVQIPLLMHASLNRQVLLSSPVVTVRYTAGLHANKANQARWEDCAAHRCCNARTVHLVGCGV